MRAMMARILPFLTEKLLEPAAAVPVELCRESTERVVPSASLMMELLGFSWSSAEVAPVVITEPAGISMPRLTVRAVPAASVTWRAVSSSAYTRTAMDPAVWAVTVIAARRKRVRASIVFIRIIMSAS